MITYLEETPAITEVGNSSNNFSFPDFEGWDEFIPYVEFDSNTALEDEENDKGEKKFTIVPDDNDKVQLSEYIEEGYQNHGVAVLTTKENKFKLPFSVTKASEESSDPDGCIEARLSIEDSEIKIIAPTKMPIETQYGQNFEIELEITSKESKEFYIDFYADDNEVDFEKGEYNKGELENVFCGRVKIVFDVPNVWEFTEEQIMQVKQYAVVNNERQEDYTLGDANRYHHCTDTHKHIALQLLKEPQGIDLGKDQDHEAERLTPRDFEKAGESTTKGVRNTLIDHGYAEPSKVFTVLDIDNNEVVKNGKPFNTKKKLSSFKESPVEYLKSKCPTDSNYVFIGAYNADYHSFAIVVTKKGDNFMFFFIDQINGVVSYHGNQLEQEKLLDDIFNYNFDYPMQLELYQLRNRKQ